MKIRLINKSLNKASKEGKVLVAVMVNGKTGQYQSHRWKGKKDALKELSNALKQSGVSEPDKAAFINKENNKKLSINEVMKEYMDSGSSEVLQSYVKKNYEIEKKPIDTQGEKGYNVIEGIDEKYLKKLEELIDKIPTSTSDSTREDSLYKHTVNGMLSPEREKLHREIILEHFVGKTPVEGQATYVIMGGGPATGKSYTIKKGKIVLPGEGNHVKIDSDDIKGKLPEYQEMLSKQDEKAAGYAHEESSALAKRIQEISLSLNYHTVLDGTGDGSPNSLKGKIELGKAKGYKVIGEYCTTPTDLAVERATDRAERTGRHVDEEVIRDTHKNVSKRVLEFAQAFDEIRVYDTSAEPTLIGEGGNGKELKATEPEKLADFYAKGDE